MVEVFGVERVADGGGGLEWRRRSHREEVVHLADGVRGLGWGDRVAEAPPRATKRLGQAGDRNGALAHAGPRRDRVVVPGIGDVLIRIVGQYHHVVLNAQRGDEGDLIAGEDAARRIVWRVEDEGARLRGECATESIGIQGPRRGLQRDEHGARAGEDAVRSVVLVKRLRDDHFVARIQECEERRRHGLRGAAGHGHLALGIDLEVVHPPVLFGDREAQDGTAPGDRVLVDVSPNCGAGRFLHGLRHREIWEALRQIDGAVRLGDPRHLADNGLGKRGGSLRRAHAVSPLCSGGQRSLDKVTRSPPLC